MDEVIFRAENNEYIIRLDKKKRLFGYSKYGQYICTIDFIDSMYRTVLSLQCTEKTYYTIIQNLNQFLMNEFGVESDIIHFDYNGSDAIKYFMYIFDNNPDFDPDFDMMHTLGLCIYEESAKGNVLRLALNMRYDYLEEFIFNLYQLIEDIPYLNEMASDAFIDFLEE